MSGNMGNPAPIGLMAFALCIFMLGALNADLVEARFKELITCFGFWWAGGGQVAVGLFELLHGNSFGALVFWTYGSLWMSLSTVWFYTRQNEQALKTSGGHGSAHGTAFGFVGAHHYEDGEAMMLFLFAFATAFFFFIALRKNRALPTCLGILFVSLVCAGFGEYSDTMKKVAGWGYMITGCSAFYILAAEIINEEWGYPVLPGLASCAPKKSVVDFSGVFAYDKSSNQVFLNLAGIHFLSPEIVDKFENAMDAEFTKIGQPAHVIVNYKGVEIASAVAQQYSQAVGRLQSKHYLSVKRFAPTAFRDADTGTGILPELFQTNTGASKTNTGASKTENDKRVGVDVI